MSNDLIVKANDVVRASYHLSVNEQRLVLSALAQLPKGEDVVANTMYFVNANNFIELGVHPKTAYRELKQAVERLYNRSIVIHSDGIEIKTRWVQFVVRLTKDWMISNKKLFDKAGHVLNIPEFQNGVFDVDEFPDDYVLVGIQFAEPILPFLVNLKNNFTSYLKQDIAGLSSAYSIRIYELIMQFKSSMYVKISLKELRDILELGDKYPLASDLKRWVIEIAINEINEKSPITASYNLVKTGKKFTHLEIRSKYKKEKKLEEQDNFIKMSENQRLSFASKLSKLPELSYLATGSAGQSYDVFAQKIAEELADKEKQKKYISHLEKLGFKQNYQK